MRGHLQILNSAHSRTRARALVDQAPEGSTVTVVPPGRTIPQNKLLWAMLSDISRAKPDGRQHTTEVWKALFMNACEHECQFEIGLDGRPFPMGFSSSRLSKAQMADLITFMYQYGDEHGVRWSDEARAA